MMPGDFHRRLYKCQNTNMIKSIYIYCYFHSNEHHLGHTSKDIEKNTFEFIKKKCCRRGSLMDKEIFNTIFDNMVMVS